MNLVKTKQKIVKKKSKKLFIIKNKKKNYAKERKQMLDERWEEWDWTLTFWTMAYIILWHIKITIVNPASHTQLGSYVPIDKPKALLIPSLPQAHWNLSQIIRLYIPVVPICLNGQSNRIENLRYVMQNCWDQSDVKDLMNLVSRVLLSLVFI